MITRNSITRPSNTTAYSIGDVINADGATTPIAVLYPNPQRNVFTLMSHLISSNEASAPEVDVMFFSESFTIAADNAAFNPSDAQMKDYYLGKISHVTWVAFAANKLSDQKPDAPISFPENVASGATVYVVLVARSAYTPISGEVITLKLDVD